MPIISPKQGEKLDKFNFLCPRIFLDFYLQVIKNVLH